jgi:DNA-binding FadR family transcriptional regulator
MVKVKWRAGRMGFVSAHSAGRGIERMQHERDGELIDGPPDQGRCAGKIVVRQKHSDKVFDRLWKMIETRELAPGDALPSERALMDRFSVGRPAVREALQSIAHKGLISISHGERSRVNQLTAGTAISQIDNIAKLLLLHDPSALDHLEQVRKLLEAGSIRLATKLCTAQDAEDLRVIAANQRSKLGQGRAFIEADIAFHMRIAAISGNTLIETLTQAMLTWLFDHYQPMLRWSGREETTLREHDRIVELLEARDSDGAEAMMLAHLNRSDPLYDATQQRGRRPRAAPRVKAGSQQPAGN